MRNRGGRRGYLRIGTLTSTLMVASVAQAIIIGGGGSSGTDCLLAFSTNANTPTTKPKNVVCIDGDPACDADGVVNGICQVSVGVCANSTTLGTCNLAGIHDVAVSHSDDNGIDAEFDPDLQALQTRIDSQILDDQPNTNLDDCTTATSIRVAIKGPLAGRCSKRTKTITITTISANLVGHIYTDKDKLKVTCLPADATANGCDAQTLFTGTFDRLQKQVFNQSCAVATCHDSNSTTGGLLLETGASSGNLINAAPVNPSANAQGWKRVTPGDSAASFIFHKVTGDLPDTSYGGRMPLGRAKLHASLQTLIQLWIDAGAPTSGWVPGTY